MKLLVTGCRGMLGHDLVPRLKDAGFELQCVDIAEMDITKRDLVLDRVASVGPDLVINCAAYTAVDQAESEQELAFAVNRDGPGYLADACSNRGIPMVHISTDYVFDGSKRGAYGEDDPVAPAGIYGRSKEAGEREVRGILESHVIVRTAWLYGVHGRNFVKTILKQARERESLRVVADQWGCPTYAADLAVALLEIAKRYLGGNRIDWGTYHYCGGGLTNWHEFAQTIIDFARKYESLKVKEIMPITTSEYPTPTRRPPNSVLDCSKIERNFGISPRPWKEALSEMIGRLYRD